MICTQCANSVLDDSRYCPQCGQPTLLADDLPAQNIAAPSEAESSAAPQEALAAIPVTSHLATPIAAAFPAALDTQKLHARLSQANLCRMRREWSNAIDHCVAALQEQPANATAHSLLSDIYRDQGKLDDAIQWARLAIELKPAPADIAKLQKLEAERTRLMRQGDSRLLGSGLSASMALAADGGVSNGTINLMGVAPRKWLNGMTTAAMVFVGATLLTLFALRYSHHNAPRPTFNSYASGANTYSNRALPPAALPARTSGLAMARPTFNSGLPPDLKGTPIVAHHTLPKNAANLPPAPVLSVRPVTASAPMPPMTSSGSMNTASLSSSSSQEDATALPAGMWIASVQFPESGNARVKIGIRPASADGPSSQEREAIVRNVYRAAKRLFDKYDAVQQVTVSVATDPAESFVFSAEVARASATSLNADTASASSLENALQSALWSVAEPQQNAGNPSSDIPGYGP